ncbi:iron-containing alcohol dehydrogenase [Succinatimonas hippei]|uniref:iron-containing alcohol dehydrogenase n=1 Tax=Succinatimonas hippei TaxID=626938 RepID=UPI0024910078|nr:iron-containing alcohol dehydrogenase [Succinatimonas hippei]
MNNFNFHRPTDIYFGRGAENNAGEICKKHGGTKVLIHFGGKSAIKSGLIDRVEKSLTAAGLSYVKLGGVQPNPRAELVYEGIELCKKEGVDMILAVGGGSVIDSSKAIAMGVPYDGDFWDFFMGGKTPEVSLPLGSVLTIAAAGSECSNSCVIDKEVNGIIKKKGSNCQANVAKFAIMNPELTMTLPSYQTACGCCDIMCHVMERYFTNTKDVEVTDQLCEGILRAMVAMIPRVMKDPNDYEARANIMWASSLAHNNLCGVDREQDWASHRIEHELSALYDCAHGAGLSVIMPAWMEHVMDHDVMRFAQFANRVFGCAMDFAHPEVTAKNGIAALRALWKSAGLPLSFADLGAKKEDIPTLLNNLGIDDHTEGHFMILKRPDVEAIFNIAANYKD